MRTAWAIVTILLIACMTNCSDRVVNARTWKDVKYYSNTYKATPNECYYALRWALKITGHPVAHEDLPAGVLTTTWEPVSSDSHYLEPFDSRDYGVTGAYYQMDVKVIPQGTRTRIEVGTRVKSVAVGLKTSGIEERKVLAQVGDYLRDSEPSLSSDGLAE